eukprot:g3622.t1
MIVFQILSLFVLVSFTSVVHGIRLGEERSGEDPTTTKKLGPVVIIPGTGGSRLLATLNKPSTKHWYCQKKVSKEYTLWLSVTSLLPPAINCWVDNIKLLWSPITKTYTNNIGVYTRVPDDKGSTENFEYLDTTIKVGESDYFHTLVESLVSAGGVRNVTVRGMPYDFRHAPSSAYNGTFLNKMTTLIEDTYELNNQQRVTILSHSMGCLYGLWFLNQKDTEWKQKYIRQWIPTAGVFGGAGSGIKQLLSGANEGIPGVAGMVVRDEQRSYESSLLLAPTPQVFGKFPIVRTPSKNWTAYDYEELFPLANFTHGYERWLLVANLTANLVHPGVDVHHLYGLGVPTPHAFQYSDSNKNFQEVPTAINGDGDGTVPSESLKSVGEHWSDVSEYTFTEKSYAKQTHTGILKNSDYLNDLVALLQPEEVLM